MTTYVIGIHSNHGKDFDTTALDKFLQAHHWRIVLEGTNQVFGLIESDDVHERLIIVLHRTLSPVDKLLVFPLGIAKSDQERMNPHDWKGLVVERLKSEMWT